MMKYSKKHSFLLALAVLQFNSCHEIRFGSFRGLSQTSSRFYQTFKTIEGISLPECAVQGANEGVSGINFRADSSECELIKGTSGCTGDATGWQAFRSCDIETAGTI